MNFPYEAERLMSTAPFHALECPLDGEPLRLSDNVWRCAAGHSFDIAKQGYVNLLPVQRAITCVNWPAPHQPRHHWR